MKSIITLIIMMFSGYLNAQSDAIDYFGQVPPGDSAIVFAPDIISLSDRYNQHGSFTPDGNEFCFTVTDKGWNYCTLYYTKFESNEWSIPQVAPFVSGDVWDPSFTPDGNNLIYTKITSVPDLWMLENEGDSWGNPVKLVSPVSSSSAEFSSSVSLNGTIYFFSRRSFDIYRAIKEDGHYNQVEKLQSPINDFDDREPYIAPDESYIIFTSYSRPDRVGDGDLYISYNVNNTWTEPINLGTKINSEYLEFGPRVTPDNNYLLFSKRDASKSMILWVSASFIEELRPSETSIISKTDHKFEIFPNPANQTIQIKICEFISDIIGYQIMNLSGKVIKQGRLESDIIDISDINRGIYLIQLKTDKEIISEKIVIE